MEDIWEKSWREEQGPRLVLRTGRGPEREAAADVSHATDIAGKGVFLEAGPRRNDFPKANASELPALCILARSQCRASRRQEPTKTQGGAESCKPRVLWGSSSAPQGSPGSHRTDSRDGCSPAPAPWQSRAQRDGMRQGYFSPSTQAPILQMTHFLHLLPITLQLVQTRCDKAVTRLLRRTAGTSSCQNKERVRGSKREGWGRGGWGDGEDPAPTSSAPPPAPEGSDAREQPLGFVPLRLREPVCGSAGWGGGGLRTESQHPQGQPGQAGSLGRCRARSRVGWRSRVPGGRSRREPCPDGTKKRSRQLPAHARARRVRSDTRPGAASPAASFTASSLGAAPSGTLPKKIKGRTLKIK
ncbi:uncharacterized protein LOC115342711 [Aquila chrysaetos chrysaetos]|uniref:uncharacterized protein LOC115342711 n=1 Tax=Aquila chrysaetos chrysaetos TaxID=223781 RepID=UPI001176BE09|nr:uncharacterized protein LOC115342711 [Aquila chrysaetos chrysaetos]